MDLEESRPDSRISDDSYFVGGFKPSPKSNIRIEVSLKVGQKRPSTKVSSRTKPLNQVFFDFKIIQLRGSFWLNLK